MADRTRGLSQALVDLPAATRVEKAYLRTLNRKATAEELDSALTYVSNFQKRFAGTTAEADAWQSFCRVLMASSDFVYVD
jgi:hypothetical protein